MWLELKLTLKDTTSNGIGLITSHCSVKQPVLVFQTGETSGNRAVKWKLECFIQNCFFECVLKDTLTTKIVVFCRGHPK